jgi:D-hydroxyproline dehydrogenase subunit alpha
METAEVVVVGAGPGGLSAALTAAQAGARVTLLDAYPEIGGQYYHQPPGPARRKRTPRQQEGKALGEQVRAAGVTIRSETVVWNVDAAKTLSLYGPRGIEELRARALILATGAYERAAAFPGWTLPGVITSGAAQILLYHRIRPGRRVLVAGTGPLQLVTAANLRKAGVGVVAVLEGARIECGLRGVFAMWGQWGRIQEGARSLALLVRRGVPYRTGWGIVSVQGNDSVESATIARLDGAWRPVPGSEQEITCDTVCISYGLVPFNTLSRLAGAEQVWQPELGGEVPLRDAYLQTTIPGIYAIGDGAGIGGYRLSMLEGQVAGTAAAELIGCATVRASTVLVRLLPAIKRERAFQRFYANLFTPGPGIFELPQADTLVCRCEGVTYGQLAQAVQDGVTTSSEAKAATRCGMGECQGRVCGHQVMHSIARLTGRSVLEVGSYNIRPPLFPIPLGAFAGEDS